MNEMTTEILQAIWNGTSTTREEDDVKQAVREWLRARGTYVCEGDAELRELALSETDLVEPSEEE